MSRTQAARTIKTREFIGRMTGVIFDQAHADALRDEAPQAYRDLDLVMRAQQDLVKTVVRLSPVLNDKRI